MERREMWLFLEGEEARKKLGQGYRDGLQVT
jgi:hypothetical protein